VPSALDWKIKRSNFTPGEQREEELSRSQAYGCKMGSLEERRYRQRPVKKVIQRL
jgi:hypothetical protein